MEINKEAVLELSKQIDDLTNQRRVLTSEKKEIEMKLSILNGKMKTNTRSMPKSEYLLSVDRQNVYKVKILKLQREIDVFSDKLRRLQTMKETVKQEIGYTNADIRIQERLFELKDKYMAFSSDPSRIGSMRIMASKFAEELESIIITFNQ